MAERGAGSRSGEPHLHFHRNWIVGELGTISACVGILAHHPARQPELQSKLRDEPELLLPAVEEILRMDAPLIANRRKTTRKVEIGGRKIGAGERFTLIWASANRDESVFTNPDEIRLDRPPSLNLLYGAGIHACPGAGLARLRVARHRRGVALAYDHHRVDSGTVCGQGAVPGQRVFHAPDPGNGPR